MPESVFVDTGYILALVNENDQHHAQAVALSEQFDGPPHRRHQCGVAGDR